MDMDDEHSGITSTTGSTHIEPPEVDMKPSQNARGPLSPHLTDAVDLVASETVSGSTSSSKKSGLDDPEVKDHAWREDTTRIPSLIEGSSNEDLFMLVRRFNQQFQQVNAIPPLRPGLLDLDVSDDEEFSLEKLRVNTERFYMTVIVGMANFGKHIARLRSWNEPRRTAGFCIAYCIAWYFSSISALLIGAVLLVMFRPDYRAKLFPPAPLAAVSVVSGNLQVPSAGVLASEDSLSGAHEAHKGEAVEQEAVQFVAAIGSIVSSLVMGERGSAKRKYGQPRSDTVGGTGRGSDTETDDTSATAVMHDLSDLVFHTKNIENRRNLDGASKPEADEATKNIESALWKKTRPFMRTLAEIAAVWERFAKTLLKEVPTNVQLTLTLLRLAEQAKAPLPPPPISPPHHTAGTVDERHSTQGHPRQAVAALKEHDFSFATENYEIEGVDPDRTLAYTDDASLNAKLSDEEGIRGAEKGEEKKTAGKKILGAIKKTANTSVSGVLGLDHVMAKLGSESAKHRLGTVAALPSAEQDENLTTIAAYGRVHDERAEAALHLEGPTSFSARYHGEKGRVLVLTSAASPCLTWAPEKRLRAALLSPSKGLEKGGDNADGISAELTIGLADIVSLRKMGGFGWKGRAFVAWATDKVVLDGLEVMVRGGDRWEFTAIRGRDELFNRLVSMGKQSWEFV
ncbi:hypothetical protein BN946_scf184499.g6 [Trametes cinnabarina]|uniref:Uncharacterized protein n=1 Tax=Pycnoporus cinnabarinus TaxID=5643 RepID=A0A060S2T4_PYCCI|nr:hypothetical protein BN946_scf184499.g6 [Trametes cinnabarina]